MPEIFRKLSRQWVRLSAVLVVLIALAVGRPTVAATICTSQSQIPASECQALVDFYISTNGDSWTNHTGWNANQTPCSWYRITCTSGHVTELATHDNHMTGMLATSLSNLSALKFLDLSYNSLTGSLPSLPPALEEIYLNGNYQLGGTIPPLPNSLRVLYLYYTNIGGTIPTLPPNIQYVALGFQPLTGSIPTLPNSLIYFGVEYTQLTGAIPLLPPTLKRLAVDNNQLTGGLPPLPSTLELLWLDNNQLAGVIPSSITGTMLSTWSRQHLCGTSNNLGSDDAWVNSFINARIPGWSPQNSCQPRLSVAATGNVALDPQGHGVYSVDFAFSESVLLPTFTLADVTLRWNGTLVTLDSRVTITLLDAATNTYRVDGLFDFTQTPGLYQLTVNAAGMTDSIGLQGDSTGNIAFTILAHPFAPAIPVGGVTDVPPPQHTLEAPPSLSGARPPTATPTPTLPFIGGGE